MRDAAVFQGRVWGVPKQADAGLLFYNKSVAGAAPATWQEVYRRAAPNRRLRYQGSQYEGLTVNFLELAYAVGAAKIVTSDGKANIDQPDARTALQFMVDGIKNGAVPREIAEQTEDSSIYAFGRGRADYMRMWPYAYAELQNPAKFPQAAGKVGVAPLPSWAGRTPVSVLGGHMLVISAFSKHPDAALKLVDFLSSAEVLKRDATEFSLAPALLALWNDQQVEQALPASAALRDAIFHARSRPVIPNYPEVSRAIYENVHRALRQDVTPEAALRQAQFEMQQAIDAH
jgi:multiple sugar transport system substrate-binding protein